MTHIIVFGDSVAWGAFDTEYGGWVERLKVALMPKHLVYNMAKWEGDTSKDVLARFDVESKIRIHDLVIVAVGGNDSAKDREGNNWVPLEDYIANLKAITSLSKKPFIFIGLEVVDESKTSPVHWDETAAYANSEMQRYNDAVEQFCKENNHAFIPTLDILTKEDTDVDGLHLNSEGHRKIFERIHQYLKENIL